MKEDPSPDQTHSLSPPRGDDVLVAWLLQTLITLLADKVSLCMYENRFKCAIFTVY